MNWGVFISVVSALGTFAGGSAAVLVILLQSRWWKNRAAKRQADREAVEAERQKQEDERHARQDAMAELVTAQLSTNGGGSLTDKVNGTRADVAKLTETVGTIAESIATNHAQGQDALEGLRAEDRAIESRLEAIEKTTDTLRVAADGLQQMADGLKVSLPEALGVQDGLVRDVHSIRDDIGSLKDRMDRAEAELFGD